MYRRSVPETLPASRAAPLLASAVRRAGPGPAACAHCGGLLRSTVDGPECLQCGRGPDSPVAACADCGQRCIRGCQGHGWNVRPTVSWKCRRCGPPLPPIPCSTCGRSSCPGDHESTYVFDGDELWANDATNTVDTDGELVAD